MQRDAVLWGRIPGRDGQVPQYLNGEHGNLPQLCGQLVPGLIFQQHLQSTAELPPGSCQHPVLPDLSSAQVLLSQGASAPSPEHWVSSHLDPLYQVISAAEINQAL